MKELSVNFKAEIVGEFDVCEFSVRLLNLIANRVPVSKGSCADIGTITVREVTTVERRLGINSNGFIQDGDERLIPNIPNGFRRVVEPL